jgi:hypothetical protein
MSKWSHLSSGESFLQFNAFRLPKRPLFALHTSKNLPTFHTGFLPYEVRTRPVAVIVVRLELPIIVGMPPASTVRRKADLHQVWFKESSYAFEILH